MSSSKEVSGSVHCIVLNKSSLQYVGRCLLPYVHISSTTQLTCYDDFKVNIINRKTEKYKPGGTFNPDRYQIQFPDNPCPLYLVFGKPKNITCSATKVNSVEAGVNGVLDAAAAGFNRELPDANRLPVEFPNAHLKSPGRDLKQECSGFGFSLSDF